MHELELCFPVVKLGMRLSKRICLPSGYEPTVVRAFAPLEIFTLWLAFIILEIIEDAIVLPTELVSIERLPQHFLQPLIGSSWFETVLESVSVLIRELVSDTGGNVTVTRVAP